jgi:hypothetical protein
MLPAHNRPPPHELELPLRGISGPLARISSVRAGSERCAVPPRTVASLDPGRGVRQKIFPLPLECSCYVRNLPCHFVNRSRGSDERHGEDAGAADWRGGCARGSQPRARHPPQPEGETHLFFTCIIRCLDRRGSTPARDRIKLNRGASPHPDPPPGGGRHRRFKQYECVTTCRLSAPFLPSAPPCHSRTGGWCRGTARRPAHRSACRSFASNRCPTCTDPARTHR